MSEVALSGCLGFLSSSQGAGRTAVFALSLKGAVSVRLVMTPSLTGSLSVDGTLRVPPLVPMLPCQGLSLSV